MSAYDDYWLECVQQAMEEAEIVATPAQVNFVAEAVHAHHDNYGLAFYQPTENPLAPELKRVKAELADELRMVHCEECGGKGSITMPGPYHSITSRCWKCDGHGRHLP